MKQVGLATRLDHVVHLTMKRNFLYPSRHTFLSPSNRSLISIFLANGRAGFSRGKKSVFIKI
jgi:hypothetical protein